MATTAIQIALKSIIYNKYYCGLCLKSIEENNMFNIQDEVMLNGENSQNLFEILTYVVGDKFLDDIAAFGNICHQCSEIVIKSFKFIKMCNDNFSRRRNCISSLLSHFDNNNYEMDILKSLYVCVNITDYTIKDYYELVENPAEKVKKCQLISDEIFVNSQLQLQYVTEYEVDSKSEFDTPKNVVRKQRETIKLTDIIYDKNDLSVLKCKICQHVFSRAPNLRKHYLTVHAPKTLKCSLCFKSYGSAISLKTHQNYSHSTAICCTQCGKMFNSIYALENHEKRHILRHVCQHCGKVYKTKHSFKVHIDEMHRKLNRNGTKPKFACDYCGKQFSQKTGIRVHMQFEHGNGKYHECEWCQKKFSSISRLKEHTITHTKDKRFSCEVCGGKFTTKMSLLYHTRTHTGEKPYPCDHCDGRFLSASRRLAHVKRHHLPADEVCDICHRKFKLRNCLLRHRVKHFDPNSKLHQAL